MKYRKGYKYQLVSNVYCDIPIYPEDDIKTEYIYLGKKGTLIIWTGYAWDGASGPTIDDNTNMRASLVHDALYQLMRQGLLGPEHRKAADDVFYLICLECGMSKVRAKYYYWSVRKFAASAADPKNRKKICEAP